MSSEKILVVEDDKDIARLVQYNLGKAGYVAETAASGEAALSMLARQSFDLVILDVMLPGVDGLEVCRQIRQDPERKHILVMMLTAKGEEIDRIVGLELGAEDYVVKPFSPRELVLRVKALLRRSLVKEENSAPKPLRAGGLVVDVTRHVVSVKDQEVVLTAMEFRLLVLLMERRGRVLDRERLLKEVWGIGADVYTRTVDTHVRRLRSKLGESGALIETVIGVGYRFREDENES
jgi:DNA-binding response OmpR family regulator